MVMERQKITKTSVQIIKNITYINVNAATKQPLNDGKRYAGTETYYVQPDGKIMQSKTMYEEISEDNPKPSANYDYTQNVIAGKMDEDNAYVERQF